MTKQYASLIHASATVIAFRPANTNSGTFAGVPEGILGKTVQYVRSTLSYAINFYYPHHPAKLWTYLTVDIFQVVPRWIAKTTWLLSLYREILSKISHKASITASSIYRQTETTLFRQSAKVRKISLLPFFPDKLLCFKNNSSFCDTLKLAKRRKENMSFQYLSHSNLVQLKWQSTVTTQGTLWCPIECGLVVNCPVVSACPCLLLALLADMRKIIS